jgi:DNA-binding NarL/FixJ family response regulator
MPIRVLVVDDDEDFLWLIGLSLRGHDDIVVIGEAQEPETGVALALQEQQLDIVVMDLMMPRINGFEATRRIKRLRPDVKVLVVTSLFDDDATRQEMYRSGADAVLGKHNIATALVPTLRWLQKASASSRGAA